VADTVGDHLVATRKVLPDYDGSITNSRARSYETERESIGTIGILTISAVHCAPRSVRRNLVSYGRFWISSDTRSRGHSSARLSSLRRRLASASESDAGWRRFHREIVFKLAAVAIVGQVDSRIEPLQPAAAVVGNPAAPFGWIIPRYRFVVDSPAPRPTSERVGPRPRSGDECPCGRPASRRVARKLETKAGARAPRTYHPRYRQARAQSAAARSPISGPHRVRQPPETTSARHSAEKKF